MSLLVRLIKVREVSVIILLIVFVGLVGAVNPDFVSASSFSILINSSMILLILAIGQSFVLMTADIDVSVGSTMGLSAAVCGTLLVDGVSLGGVIIAVLAVGAVVGLINGFGVSKFKIPAIIMTLGMLGLIRGLMLIYTNGEWIEDIPNAYKQLSDLKWLGLNLPVWIGLILLIGTHFVVSHTKFGQNFFALGDNPEGAKLVGLPVSRTKILAFVFSGMSASIAGLVFVMNIGNVPSGTGDGMELTVIAAAVLGGVSLTGGLGSIIGAGLGAIFLTVIENSLVFLKIPAYWNNAISGLLLLVIVVSDVKFQSYLKRDKVKKRRPKVPDKDQSSDGNERRGSSEKKDEIAR